jgi:uncharacterized surface protein with fasciclin (FAS1) repeats
MNKRDLIIATSALWLLAGCATQPAPMSVAETIAHKPELSTLHKLIQSADLGSTLNGTGPFTLFAPHNDAFAALPASTLEALARDKAALGEVLKHHLLASKVSAAEVKNGSVSTAQGSTLSLAKAGNFVTVEEAVVTTADVNASNGVIHVIDRVLMPPKKK